MTVESGSVTNLAPTTCAALMDWVATIASFTKPDRIEWCDGSDEEWRRLTDLLVEKGTYIRVSARPNSFLCRTQESDAVRIVDRTYICSERQQDAGPTNQWMAPARMRNVLEGLFEGCMRGRTMYVVPFCMGPVGGPISRAAVQITDSAHAVASIRIGSRMGTEALRLLERQDAFVRCMHSVGSPLEPGEADVAWPCNDTKYIAHFPESGEVWSFGSGFGDNSALPKKSYALRMASTIAHDEGWLAEHMLVVKVTQPEGASHYIAAAYPAGCGKTNMALASSVVDGWTIETVADDVAWMKFGADGRLYAVNAEAGLLGVTGQAVAPTADNVIESIRSNTIFTNVALTDDGDVWWEGLTAEPPAHLIDWRGEDWHPESGRPSAHPLAKFTTPADQCITIAQEWNAPQGVPISAILFVGRRFDTVPLICEAFDWKHGVFLGANLAVESRGKGVRRDPFSMRTFCGYNMADYFQHWLQVGSTADETKLPRMFLANWFRQDESGRFLWPGFDENTKVLKWVVERIEGRAEVVSTPVGYVPVASGALAAEWGIDDDDLSALLMIERDQWLKEADLISAHLQEFGDKVPDELWNKHTELLARLG